MKPANRPDIASEIALPWIVRLRYAMVAAQIGVAAAAVYLFGMDLPLAWMAPAPLLVGASNWWLARRIRQPGRERALSTSTLVASAFVIDMLCLTELLMLSGGPANPFTLLYLVHITLSATILTQRQTWALGALSILCFGLLFHVYRPVAELQMHSETTGANLHLIGMWIGFTIAVFLVALYAAKVSGLLRDHEVSLRYMDEELARKDRLASLATLSAGAAHELNTPLGTIAIVAHELERLASKTPGGDAMALDCRLIRQEVDRCHQILLRMSDQGAAPAGEALEPIDARALVDRVCREFPSGTVRVEWPATATPLLLAPPHAVEQAVTAVVKNAVEASEPGAPVAIRVGADDGLVNLVVADTGAGMPAETLRRIGEPFFTTKEPGAGMGLGIFLARTVIERLGGTLTFRSSPGSGTEVTITLPEAGSRTTSAEGVVSA